MSYKAEREQFIAQMAQQGLPISTIRTILARANTLQRNAELSCSSEAADRDRVPCPAIKRGEEFCACDKYHGEHEMIPRIDRQSARIAREVQSLMKPYAYVADCHGDPRGYVLTITNNVGREFGVPSRGLPASFWERH